MSTDFLSHFGNLKDPRDDKNKRYPLMEVLFLTIAAVVSGAEGWEAIEEFGKAKIDWLRRFFPYTNGVPLHDRVRVVMISIAPKHLQECFASWVAAAAGALPDEVVAIDGKTLRRSYDRGSGRGPIHMVSAWAKANGVCLGQVKTDAKSNEITAIPQLLELLELRGCIVTLDAMGCQREIAQAIQDKGADYVLAVKDNQPNLHEAIVDYFETADRCGFEGVPVERHHELDSDHGRIEQRRYELVADLRTLPNPSAWTGLKAIGRAIRECTQNGKTSVETRYYIVSFAQGAVRFAGAVRGHWGVENSLHWVLDVTFGEDDCRIRSGYGAENFAVIRHIALNLLKRDPSKGSVRKKLFRAALNDDFRFKLLSQL
jgi:predicted transposase YbfD/YdcC